MTQINVNNLFQNAEEEGLLSPQSMQVLGALDPGEQIREALGVNVADDVQAREVVLVTIMIDDSASIATRRNTRAVIEGYNLLLQSLLDSKQGNNIFIHTCYLNGQVLYPYTLIQNAVVLDEQNYRPDGGTPLYDQTVVIFGTVIAKIQECVDNNIPARTITLLVTDGFDEHSRKANPAMCAAVATDLLATERNIVAAMGIDDGKTNFRQIFQSMGILDQWILTPQSTPSEIRKAFRMVSRTATAVQATQGAKSFTQTALGGFGN